MGVFGIALLGIGAGLTLKKSAAGRLALKSVAEGVSKGAKVWIALWVVYIVWGSTYLAIELAGETMPGFFGAGVRFTIAGLLMLGFVAWRRGLSER